MADSHPTSKKATLPEDRKTRKHAADPQVTSDASSSDDDWFNKSLDDFEIPTKDVQSGDDSSEDDWFGQSSEVLQIPAKDPDDRWADRNEAETDGSLHADNGDVSSNYTTARNDDVKDHPVESVDKQDEKSEAVMCETSCVPEKAGDHGPNSDKRTPCSEEGAARSDGETSDDEEETHYTHASIGPTMKLTSTASGAQHGLTVTGDRKSSRERESAEEGNGVPAERDEEWFQRNLKELPTLFNLTRIHRLTTARYIISLPLSLSLSLQLSPLSFFHPLSPLSLALFPPSLSLSFSPPPYLCALTIPVCLSTQRPFSLSLLVCISPSAPSVSPLSLSACLPALPICL